MAQNSTAMTGQIPNELVARTMGELGKRRAPKGPQTEIVNVAFQDRHSNVSRGLLLDSGNRENIAYAWTNQNRTSWKVESEGSNVIVEDVSRLETAEGDEPVADNNFYVQGWIDILLKELRTDIARDSQTASVSDEIEFIGQQTLRLRDVEGRIAEFTFSIE